MSHFTSVIPCQCTEFFQELLNLSKEIFAMESKKLQWTALENFVNQHDQLWYKRYTADFNGEPPCPCITSHLNSRLKVLNNSDKEPSILILDILSNIFFLSTRHFRSSLICIRKISTSFPSDYENLRTLSAFHGPVNFMKLLVNYGHLSSFPRDLFHLMKETNGLMFNFILSVSGTRNIHSIFERTMDLIKSFFRGNKDGEFYKRLFFVGVALNAVRYNLNKDYNETEKLINYLRMYFSATRDLYLTVYEVRSVLYGTFVLLNQPHLFDTYSQEFDNLMPECPATQQPRKATHIARCQIRENLKACKLALPAAIEKLQLPQNVKRFVVGDVFEFPSKNGNTSAKHAVTKSELERLLFGRPSS